jgi:hypothetical protein
MKNLASIMELITAADFNARLIEDNRSSLLYYNDDLGFGAFKDEYDARPSMTDEEVFALCDNFFNWDRVQAILAREKASASANPFYGSSFQSVEGPFFSGLVLASTDSFTVVLMALHGYEIEVAKQRREGDRRTLAFGGVGSYVRFFRGRDIKLRTWSIPPFSDDDDLSALRLKPELGPVEVFQTGDRRAFGPHETFEYVCEGGSSALMMQVQMHRNGRPMALEFDVDTGALIGASSPAQEPTRLQMLATAMRMFERHDAFDDVLQLLDHPAHFVRWHGMRECIGMDSQRAYPHLVRLSEEDPQPSVQRAAMRTLEQFYPAETAIAAE